MKKLLVLALSFVLALSLYSCSSPSKETANTTDKSFEKVQSNKKLVVGLCAAYPPFESRNESTGKIEGFDIDLSNEIGKELGVRIEIKDAEWQALLGGLNKGDYDILITCMSKREAASQNVNMSDVYYNLSDSIVIREDNNLN